MARIDGLTLTADDGAALGATWTRAPRAAPAVVLVAGATAVPHRFYARWSADLADRGFDVLTFDFRGIGASRTGPLSGVPATLQDWGRRDLAAALDEALREADGRPVLLVGHSFGGQALGLVPGAERLAGGVTIASGWGWWGFQPWWRRPGLLSVWYGAIPLWTGLLGYVPAGVGLGDGLPGGVAAEWARWCRSPGYLLDHVPDARERFAAIEAPFHVLALSDDAYIPPPAVAALAEVLPAARLEVIDGSRHGGVGHFGFFRPAAKALWDDVAARLAALATSGARREARSA
jgi:predicted alpha/beta hydrolase